MDGGRRTSGFGGSGENVMTKGGNGMTIVQTFGKESRGDDMHGGTRDARAAGGIHSLSHSISGASVTGVPTVGAPHKTTKAV